MQPAAQTIAPSLEPQSAMLPLIRPYISDAAAARAAKYQYVGRDNSLLYQNVGSPLAQWCVDNLLPRWVAPNLVTLSGLFLLIFTYLICFVYNHDLDSGIPAWASFLAAVTLALYALLDNMDGKQARRTGTSSALGLLFDHGCDALGPLTIISSVGIPATSIYAPTVWCIGAVPFFLATWEEFHTGTFDLPVVNGPNEGLLIMQGLYLISAASGKDFWAQHALTLMGTHLSYTDALMGFFVVAVLCTAGHSVATIAAQGQHQPALAQGDAKLAHLLIDHSHGAVLERLSPVVALCAAAFLGFAAAPGVVQAAPFLYFSTLGAAFTVAATELMLSHVCVLQYTPTWSLVLSHLFASSAVGLRHAGLLPLWGAAGDSALFVAVSAYIWGMATYHAVSSVRTLSRVLNLPVFTIRSGKAT